MIVEKQMECRLAGETEVLGENLPQRHFCPSQNPTWPDPSFLKQLCYRAPQIFGTIKRKKNKRQERKRIKFYKVMAVHILTH
jgi:hypothetical protein